MGRSVQNGQRVVPLALVRVDRQLGLVQVASRLSPLPPLVLRPTWQDGYRNQGGFHMIGSGRDAIAKPDQLAAAETVRCAEMGDAVLCASCGGRCCAQCPVHVHGPPS